MSFHVALSLYSYIYVKRNELFPITNSVEYNFMTYLACILFINFYAFYMTEQYKIIKQIY